MAIALAAAAVSVNRGTYSASISDASGYVAAAALLREGRLARPVPLQLVPAVRDSGANTSPLGFRAGLETGAEVPLYPLGYPMLMAAAMHVGGELAAYLVGPLLLAALIFCVFVLTELLAGGWAGVVAAALVATNPIALQNSVTAMSDVPAAACWTAAWYFSLRRTAGSACTAGMLVSLAALIRPNLVPLAVVPGMLVLSGCALAPRLGWRWRDALVFAAAAAPGPLVVLWSQAALYGNAFRPGYPGYDAFFSLAHVVGNLRTYPALFVSVHGWLLLAGLGAVAVPGARAPGARAIEVSAVALIAINGALYLPYLPYSDWPFLRFFLPATVALTVLFATLVGASMDALRQRRLSAASWMLPLVAVGVVAWQSSATTSYVLSEWRANLRVPVMGRYLREVLPRHAVVISFFHGGSVAFYTGHNVVSLESMSPSRLDALIANLERYGCAPVFVVDESLEEAQFQALFKESAYAALDWPARAEFVTTARIRYFIASDRQRHRAGERWATDVLRP